MNERELTDDLKETKEGMFSEHVFAENPLLLATQARVMGRKFLAAYVKLIR